MPMETNSATNYGLGWESLNSHGYTIGKVPSQSCQCHHKNETVQNYVLDCLLCYLFSEVNQSVPNIYTMSKTNKLQLLLFGFPDNDHYEINKIVLKAVQKSLKTKLFLIRQ